MYYGTSGLLYDSNFPIMVLLTANTTLFILILKGKAIPVYVWTGPEGFRRLKPQNIQTIGT